jgi:hypothetical protein
MRIWVPAVAAAMLAVGAPAHADLADFDGAEIVVGSPAEYCVIAEEQFSVLPTLLLSDDPGDILIAFARCEEIDEVAAGATDTFLHYGLIVGVRDAEGEAIRPGKPLVEYLGEFDAAQFEAQGAGPRATTVGMNGDHFVEIEPFGLVSKTDQAHFAAMTIRPQDPGRGAIAAVIGRTLIDGRAVQVELYAPEEDAPIPELIVLGHETVGALWEANAATAGSGAVTMDSDFEADENAAADGSIEESEQEDGSFSTDEPLSEDEEVAAAFEEMSALAGKSFQPLYWAVVLYLSASILLGIGIWVSFKLRPRAA